MELFTNKEATADGTVAITAPAFSITKVQTAIGLLGAAILGIVPTALKDDQAIIITSIAAVTVILLGIFMLVAVDMTTRQRAEEAKLKHTSAGASPAATKTAIPAEALRVMQGGNDQEYAVEVLKVEDETVRLLASRNGQDLKIDFKVV